MTTDHGPYMESLWRAHNDAETGSHQLKLSIEAMFDNFAAKHRISYKDASELILNFGLRRR